MGLACAFQGGFTGPREQLQAGRLLAVVETLVGNFEQILSGASVPGIDRQADAHTEERELRLLTKANSRAVGNLLCHGGVGVDEEHGKFVAAKAGSKVTGAAIFFQDAGEALEGTIAGKMAEVIVDALEIVKIKKQQGEGTLRARSAQKFPFEGMEKFAVGGEASQTVVRSLVADLLLGLFALGDIDREAEAADDGILRVAERFKRHVEDAIAALEFETRGNSEQGI